MYIMHYILLLYYCYITYSQYILSAVLDPSRGAGRAGASGLPPGLGQFAGWGGVWTHMLDPGGSKFNEY